MDDKALSAPYQRTTGDVLTSLSSDVHAGLSAVEAQTRLASVGPNLIAEGQQRGLWVMLLSQFADFMILVLLAAAVVSGVVGDLTDTLVILIIVVLNAVVGFVQEYRAEKALAALRQMAALHAQVVRDGHTQRIAAAELVPGDIVLLEAGNVVPADLRLLEVASFKVQEAALTGESIAVDKSPDTVLAGERSLGDRVNMAYKGTLAVHGRCRGVVVATGMATELGHVARLLASAEETKTPLQKRLARFGRVLALVVLALCAILFFVGVSRGEPALLMLLTAISLAVAAIPEALPAVVTLALALGARQLVRQHALVRKLPAVETLGSVTYICSDKTGTLTLNKMRVDEIWYPTGQRAAPPTERTTTATLIEMLQAMALNNDSHIDHLGNAVGEPTEVALLEAAREAGYPAAELVERLPRIAELPFDSNRRCMTTLHRAASEQNVVVYIKGSPEAILALCSDTFDEVGPRALDRDAVLAVANEMAADGFRVLAFARRVLPSAPNVTSAEIEKAASFLGLAALQDPPREEARHAIAECIDAGIVPVMITGDHPETARSVARKLGILRAQDEVVTGVELSQMSDDEFALRVSKVRVYARAAPEQKIRIVQALQKHGEFVAMTGDGVNDAPALKRADIGVAMGITGTDVAKEAAHMTLLDDNFATIVKAVRAGRRIFDNIRKFIKYTMTSNSGEIWAIFLAPLFGLPIPLLPIHILWINLVTDGLPGLALSSEPEERGVMQRPPRPPNESIFAHGMWQHILWVGLLMGGASLFTQAWAINTGHGHWQTMVFTVLTLSQLGHVLAIRSERDSLFTQGLWSNRPLLLAVSFTFALQMMVIYVPWFNAIFKTEALSFGELIFCLLLSSVVFVAVEIEKWLIRRGWIYTNIR